MAKRKSTQAEYEAVMDNLKTGRYAPVYLLMGDESYYIDKISDYIERHALTPEEQDFNQTVVFGADVTSSQVVDLAKEYPMMAQRRVVIVKEAQALKNTEALERYLDRPVKSTVLVLCHKNGSMDKRKKLPAKVAAVGVLFESERLRDEALPTFVEQYLGERNAAIEPKAAYMIADQIGSDLNRLTSELDKLLIPLPAGNRQITPEMVETQIGLSKDFNAFELRDAIVKRDIFKAERIVNYLDKNPKTQSVFKVVPMIYSYFQNLMLAYYAPNKFDAGSVASYLGYSSPWAGRDYVAGVRNYSGRKTMEIISKFREFDAKSKGIDNPNTSVGDLFRELVFFILH